MLYNNINARGATVVDVERRETLHRVLKVNTRAGWVKVSHHPIRLDAQAIPYSLLRKAGMTIKQDIERSAEQLGRSVRQALNDFNRETGMQARLEIDWVSCSQFSENAPVHLVGHVRVEVAGLTVQNTVGVRDARPCHQNRGSGP